jgi:hypothetical protein
MDESIIASIVPEMNQGHRQEQARVFADRSGVTWGDLLLQRTGFVALPESIYTLAASAAPGGIVIPGPTATRHRRTHRPKGRRSTFRLAAGHPSRRPKTTHMSITAPHAPDRAVWHGVRRG